MSERPRLLPALLAALLLGGCAELAYYAQAIHGHARLMHASRPLADVLDDPETPAELRNKLESARRIRDFASRELALPDNASYRRYASLGRPYVVWNVFAAGEFSVEPMTWCPWFVGCVGYRGYYARRDAETLKAELTGAGFDAWIAGVPAYSTLGHFDDPLLDSFLRFDEIELARLLFHELAHQQLYVKGDTAFNEAFATVVEAEGLKRWLAAHGTPEQHQAWTARNERRRRFLALVEDARQRLTTLYGQAGPVAAKRQAKAAIFARLRDDVAGLRNGRSGDGGEADAWLADGPNNARLVAVALYTHDVPVLERLLADAAGDLPDFYRRAARLATLPAEVRRAQLQNLISNIK